MDSTNEDRPRGHTEAIMQNSDNNRFRRHSTGAGRVTRLTARCADCATRGLAHTASCPVGRGLGDTAAIDRDRFALLPVREAFRPLSWAERQHLPLIPDLLGIRPEDLTTTMMRVTLMAPGLRARGIGRTLWFLDCDVEFEGALDAVEDFLKFVGGLPQGTLATFDERHRIGTVHMRSVEVER